MDTRTVGILGGGQLGRMLVEAANRLNIRTIILDSSPNAPAKQINSTIEHINGSFTNDSDIVQLASRCDVLTIEIEHVNVNTLYNLQSDFPNLLIYPSPATVELIQDKYVQKTHLISHNIPVATSVPLTTCTYESIEQIGAQFGYPFMLKSRTFAYDGRGNFKVDNKDSINQALDFLKDRPLYAEKWCLFIKELAVIVVRSTKGNVYSYPTVETVHRENICHLVYAPARIPDSIQLRAKLLAQDAIQSFPTAGIFGVEMFLLPNNELIINEIAPRPHNSGHYTIDACVTSQFEAHLRAILDLPLPNDFASFSTPTTNAIMLNVLGDKQKPNEELQLCKRAMSVGSTSVYLYGKESKPSRKLGHINIVSASMQDCERKLQYITEDPSSSSTYKPSYVDKLDSRDAVVGIIMGSDSDLPVMSAACNILEQFKVPYEVTIVSAHRTPHRLTKYAIDAAKRGIKSIIAGAGGAAHLPGMVAAMTPLPVIGVPVKGSSLDGVDSLYSIVQMPRGIPVATVAINNSTNAALLAIRLLASSDPSLFREMQIFMSQQEEEVLAKAEKLEKIGYQNYLPK